MIRKSKQPMKRILFTAIVGVATIFATAHNGSAPFGLAINSVQGTDCGQGYCYAYQALENSGFACIDGQATDNNDTNSEQLNIVMKDSSYVSYLFSDKPKVVVNKDTLDVITPVVELKLKMADVAYFCFGNVPEDITDIKEASITTSDNSPLVIYSIDGTQMRQISGGSAAAFKYSELPRGIYIVKKGQTAHKIIVR